MPEVDTDQGQEMDVIEELELEGGAIADVQPTEVPQPSETKGSESEDESIIDALFQSLISSRQTAE